MRNRQDALSVEATRLPHDLVGPATCGNRGDRRVNFLSAPMSVNMGDWWFDIATLDHFWVKRRFYVMKQLADQLLRNALHVAEIGCGNGLLQRQIEDAYGITVTGFDLNEIALRKNISRASPLFCYNIHERRSEFHGHFDLFLMFDVLEHVANEFEFLQSVKYHLTNSGTLLVNVPAHQFLYSNYDRAAGHVRRYSIRQLEEVALQNGLKVHLTTYWGLSLVPLLLARKVLNLADVDGKTGFDSRGHLTNGLLSLFAQCEMLPQRFLGTSVMAVLKNQT